MIRSERPDGTGLLPTGSRPLIQAGMELAGVVNVGGVGDVLLQIAAAAARDGYPTTILLPWFGKLALSKEEVARNTRRTLDLNIDLSFAPGQTRSPEAVRFHLLEFRVAGACLELCLVESPRFRGKQRPYTYTAEEAEQFSSIESDARMYCGAERPPMDAEIRAGHRHYDYAATNVLFQKAILEFALACGLIDPIFHAHDGQVAPLAMLARCNERYAALRGCTFVLTVHNCGEAYRQRCGDTRFLAAAMGVPESVVRDCVVDEEFDPVAANALYNDHTNTVSDGYAWEVEIADRFRSGGDQSVRGLSRFLDERGRRFLGITNGVASELKGPEALPDHIRPAGLETGTSFGWKNVFKGAFLRRANQPPAEWGEVRPLGDLHRLSEVDCLFTSIGRMTEQKSPFVLLRAVEEVLEFCRDGVGVCLLGDSDDPRILEGLTALTHRFSGRVVVFRGFSSALAAEVYAAGDFLLIPSQFEPCGLTDYQAQLNGSIPIANQVGGLAKVVNNHTGLGYFALDDRSNLRGLVDGMYRALALFADGPALTGMRVSAATHVRANCTWDTVFPRYRALYAATAHVA